MRSGDRIGHFEVMEPLGAGGMGQVWRARDTRLKRDVALKVLPDALASDAQAMARFRREAELMAAVQDPNIAAIHSIEEAEAGGTRVQVLVLELVEGRTLAQRLNEGPLPVSEALEVGARVARALQAAHACGVVHRDLKPANVMLATGGGVKVLDFGIAKVSAAPADGSSLSDSAEAPTLLEETATGVLVGTAPYMSPEQVRSRDVDSRTDVWALGCLLYEMITGSRAFSGEMPGEVLAAVLADEPRWERLPDAVPEAVLAMLRSCLHKDPDHRDWSAAEARRTLEAALGGATDTPSKVSVARRPLRTRNLVAAAAVAAVALAIFAFWPRGGHRVPVIGEITRLTSLPGQETGPVVSPDGSLVAFSSTASGNRDIWIRRFDGGAPLQITDHPDDDDEPDFSPDGALIAFHSRRDGGGIFVVPPLGGDILRVSDFGYRPRWSPDGSRLLFQLRGGNLIPNEIYTVEFPASAPPRRWLAYEEGGEPYWAGEWSPDGRFVLVSYGAYRTESRWRLVSLDGSAPVDLVWDGQYLRGSGATWAPDGSGVLLLVEDRLSFLPLSRDGAPLGPPEAVATGSETEPRFSSDGRRIVYSVGETSADVWRVALDPTTGLPAAPAERITSYRDADPSPLFVPGVDQLVFRSWRDGASFLFASDPAGGEPRLLDRSHDWSGPNSFYGASPDGRWIHLLSSEFAPRTPRLLPVDPATGLTGPPRVIGGVGAPGERALAMNWSPDSRRLMVWTPTLRDEPALFALEEPWSDEPRLVRYELAPEFVARFPHHGGGNYSPDGEWIAFPAYRERHRPAMFLLRTGETLPRLLLEGVGFVRWMSDPERIHVFSERDDATYHQLGFVRIDPDTGDVLSDFVPIPLQPTPHGVTPIFRHSMTPDRRWLYFQFNETEGDVYAAEIDWR